MSRRRRTAVIRPAVPPTPARLRTLPSVRLSSALGVPTAPITFPVTPLKVKVELALGADLTAAPVTWSWADVTGYVYTRDAISITRGRGDEASTADTSTLEMTVDNRDGRWSTRNPMGPWYGQLRKGTPIRVSAEGYVRFTGFLAELPPRWDVSGNDRYAPLAARGLFYRLTQGASPERSAMKRSILGSDPVAYWPLEDVTGATSAASAIGGPPMAASGVTFGTFTSPAGSEATPDLFSGPGSLKGSVSGGSATSWHVGFAMSSPYVSPVVARVYADSVTHNIWRLALSTAPGDGPDVFITDADGGVTTGLSSPTEPTDFPNTWHHYAVSAEQSGSNIISRLYVDGVLEASSTVAGTLGAVTAVWINHQKVDIDSAAHVEVGDGILSTGSAGAAALNAYEGELAHTRFLRLCAEEALPATAVADTSQAMGPQPVEALLSLVRECEATDQGYMFEGLDFGLVFQGHTARENLAPAFPLNYTAPGHVAPPLEPTDDDQQARNDIEVIRDGGSSSRLTETSTDVELSIPNIGRRDESVTYSLYTDEQTYHLAGWRLHMGTWPGYRFPILTLNLMAAPSLIPTFCTSDLAFLTTVANPPTDIGPDLVSVIVEGYAETLDQFGWDVAANCSLYGPWRVGVLALPTGESDPTLGWLDWDSCVLATDVDSDDVSWQITADPVDSTVADDYPRDVQIGGEIVTVTACSGAPQTWTVTRSVNGIVKSHTAGERIALAYPFILAL